MKKTIKLISLLVVLCMVCSFALAACNNAEKETLKTYVLPQNETLIDSSFNLPSSIGYGENALEVTWTSSNTDRIAIGEKTDDGYPAVVTLADGDVTEVTLTLSVVGSKLTKEFKVRVDCYDVYRFYGAYSFKMMNKNTYESFDLDQTVSFQGKTIDIKWSVEDEDSKAVISVSANNKKCEVKEVEVDTPVKIRATFTYNEETTHRDYNFTVIPVPNTLTFFDTITAPTEGEYVYGLYQGNIQKYLFAKAELDGKYIKTTEDPAEAAVAKLAKSGDNWTIQLDNKYVEIADGAIVLKDAQTAGFVWTWNDTYKIFTTVVGEETMYLGCYNQFETISASKISYLTTSNVDVTQHPARFGEAEICEIGSFRHIKSAVAGDEYVFGVHQGNIGKWLYATAEMDGKYIKTTEDATKAAVAKLIKSGDGWIITLDGKYLEITSAGEATLLTQATEGFVWTWNDTFKAFTAPSGDNTMYLGCYNTYETIGASNVSYISGDNAKNLDVTQHPARLGTPVLSPVTEEPELPEAEKVASLSFANSDNGIKVTKEGEYTNYEKETVTGPIQKSVTANGITLTNDIGTSTNAITTQYDSQGSVRLYKSTNLTISYTSAVSYMVLEFATGYASIGTFDIDGATITITGTTVTIVFDTPTTSITLVGLANQVRLVSIEMYA